MEKGFCLTDEGTLSDAKAARAAGFSFAYFRGRKVLEAGGQKDDANITATRDALRAAGIAAGIFLDLDWRSGAQAAKQASELAAFVRQDDVLPPAIRLWEIKGASITDWQAFTYLVADTAYYLDQIAHRKPVILANQGQIRQITSSMAGMSSENQAKIASAWWGVISWGDVLPVLPAPWTKYPFWVQTNHNQAIPGAINVGLASWPGTLAQLRTWAGNPTMDNLPAWGAVEPEPDPEDPPVDPPPAGEVTLADLLLEQQRQTAILERLAAHLGA